LRYCLNTRLSEPPTVKEEGLFRTVLRKLGKLAYIYKCDHNMEVDEQSQEELPISELLLEQHHTATS